ncbi:MAG: microcin ABC transporter ATP-binding protein [Tistrella sp.]|uniref:Microcin ABC transporter ATP-binding protein n=1 Tax=Tistrella mobilis TaxID=171437 RepID=A0A3B9IKF2_9PROT|nr:ABC transporter ATP-binding protein [Tistrella sp.]MAD39339.1 microcin ABC transporter ATP-binding protein [Tistrella sp.]MBA76355.1 microcin ABC transporter ATP-binding protein [Tistrella sp.]HAE47787.1 microcin ABC transporter ATP-binding protein [Tistrella mobilis]
MTEAQMTEDVLLSIRDLKLALPKGADRPFAVDGVSYDLKAGEILCVVGESGSGKSMAANAVMGLLPPGVKPAGGQILFEGRDLLALDEAGFRELRAARVAMIFQEPMTALNPLMRVGEQIAEVFEGHNRLKPRERRTRALELLTEVGIPDPARAIDAYPFQLSGGQRQRVMIAMALALEPRLLIADEPTTALDVTTQAQILELIRDLQRRHGMGVMFITHDFGVVAEIADRVCVMRYGQVVEIGTAAKVLGAPEHEYTRGLIDAIPGMGVPDRKPVEGEVLLKVRGLTKTYHGKGGLTRKARVVKAVDDISFDLARGETLGIVGESGSGKSTLGRCIVRLIDPETGSAEIGGVDLATLNGAALRRERRRVQMVFQDPYGSLNPRTRVGQIIAEGPIAAGVPAAEARKRARELLEVVGLDASAADRFPHEFSGGQRQRIGIARALALDPELIIADEAVSALDVSIQAQVLDLLAELKTRLRLSMLFVTHDLRVAAQICDRIAVMQRGRIVELGPVAEVFGAPKSDYTRDLLAAIPGRGPGTPLKRFAAGAGA